LENRLEKKYRMIQYSEVRLITAKYEKEGAKKGDIGTVLEIYQKKDLPIGYDVAFPNPKTGADKMITVFEEDIEPINS
jgi:hypothetical protein